MGEKRCGSCECAQDLKWGILRGWPMDHLIVYDELEGRETQGERNMEERLLSIWVGQMRA